MQLFNHSQISTAIPSKFGNGQVISPHPPCILHMIDYPHPVLNVILVKGTPGQYECSLLGKQQRIAPWPWWRHQMETFSALLAFCAGNSPIPGKFPSQRPVTRSFDIFFDLWLNKRLSKQSWGWWFETPSRSLWRHCNDSIVGNDINKISMQIHLHIGCVVHVDVFI